MSRYFDLSIKKIEIKKPKRDLKPIVELQNKVDKTLPHDKYYYPTDEKTIKEYLSGDYILLGVYDRDKLIAASFAFENGLFFSRPITDWMQIPGNKIMCHEFVVVNMEYRGNGIQKRFMDVTVREARRMGYDTIWCCAHPDNTPSVCSIESTGYKLANTFVVNGWPRNVYYRGTAM